MITKPYRQDLAYLHNVGFGLFAERSAPGLLRLLRRVGISSGLVVDLGCGGGLWARHLVDAGYDVLGIDLSSDMIALARRRAPEATFRTGSFLDAALPRCAVVTALGECLNYIFDQRNRCVTLRGLFSRIYDALSPGGLFIFDIAEPRITQTANRRFWTGPDWACLTEYQHDRRRNLLTRRMITFRKVGRHYRRDEETHVQRLYDGTQLADDLRRLGFHVRILKGYGRFRLPQGRVALHAQKP